MKALVAETRSVTDRVWVRMRTSEWTKSDSNGQGSGVIVNNSIFILLLSSCYVWMDVHIYVYVS